MIGIIFALAAAGMAPAGVAPAAAPKTIQQLFDGAGAASERGEKAAALAGYDEIERRIGSGGRPATLAIVRARRGVLLAAAGREEEAVPALRYALANLSPRDPTLNDDRYLVARELGRIAEIGLDYAAATRAYREAQSAARTPADARPMWAAEARVTMFDDPAAALKLADKALAAAGDDPAQAKVQDAKYRTLKARVMLNAGDVAGARRELDQAVKALGGLSIRLDLDDVSARSDLALAALLAGDKEAARKYLAYTGAGTLRDVLAPPAADMDVPACGGSEGLTPEDVAVVELSIRDDGSVGGVAPIYVSRPGPAALAFARAVSNWAWTPQQAAQIKPFFRALVRVELRCSLGQRRPDIVGLLKSAAEAWFARRNATLPDARGATREDRLAAVRDGLALAEAGKAPADAIAFFAIQDAFGAAGRGYLRMRRQRVAAALVIAASRPSIAADPHARNAVRLVHVDMLMNMKDYAAALPMLEAIAGDTALEARDPIKVGALLRLATVKAANGDLVAARAAYQRTGLTAQECALVDTSPALVSSNGSSSDFPREAMQWGFEGWAQTEFDVKPDGHTANVRAIAAYPPFIFSPASVTVAAKARYTQSYRPEGGLGCGGERQKIRFALPGFKR